MINRSRGSAFSRTRQTAPPGPDRPELHRPAPLPSISTGGSVEVVLINPPYLRRVGSSSVEPIGLASLAATLSQQGIAVRVLDIARELERATELPTALEGALSKHEPDLAASRVIGVGPLVTATLETTKFIIDFVRATCSARIVVGGPLCSAPGIERTVPAYLDVDAYVAGDGEAAIRALVLLPDQEWGAAAIPGVGWPGGPQPAPDRVLDLDSLPIPDRGSLDPTLPSLRRSIARRRTTSAFLSRGCPYSCSFCAAPLASGRHVRRFSASRITAEIAACMDLEYTNIIFYDDCLFVRGSRLDERIQEFVSALTTAGWTGTYQLELRCDVVVAMRDESLHALKSTGLRQVNMGIEKAHVAALKQIRKRLTPEVASDAVLRLRSAKIRTAGTFILGGIGEGADDLDSVGDYANGLKLDFAHFNPLAIYPGTALFDQVFGEGADWLHLCLDREHAPRGDILWRSETVSLEQVATAATRAYRRFYTDDRLRDVLSRTPEPEHESIRIAFRDLAETRATHLTSRAAIWFDNGRFEC